MNTPLVLDRAGELRSRVAECRAASPSPALVDALNELGLYLYAAEPETGLQLTQEAEFLAQNLNYQKGLHYSQINHAYLEMRRGDFQKVATIGADLLQKTKESRDHRLRGLVQELNAAALHRLGEIGAALAHALLALEQYEQSDDVDGTAAVLNLIGICYGHLENFGEATRYMERALILQRQQRDERRVVLTLGNITWNSLRAGQVAKAQAAIEECGRAYDLYLTQHGVPPYPDFPVYLNLNRAKICTALRDYEGATHYAEIALAASEHLPEPTRNNNFICWLQRTKATIDYAMGNTTAAIERLTHTLDVAQRSLNQREQMKCHNLLALCHKAQGDPGTALEHFEQYYALEKILFTERHHQMVIHTQTLLETQAARREAELLSAKNAELEQMVAQLRLLNDQVQELSIRDGLTGLFNRRYLDEMLPRIFAALAPHTPLTVAIADIDNFKQVNDTFRHHVGDEVLQAIAILLQGCVTDEGFVARYGGEEFVVVMPGIDGATALAQMETFRTVVENHAWETIALGLRVTATIGIGDRADFEDAEDMLQCADNALYEAKQRGKNQVLVEQAMG